MFNTCLLARSLAYGCLVVFLNVKRVWIFDVETMFGDIIASYQVTIFQTISSCPIVTYEHT